MEFSKAASTFPFADRVNATPEPTVVGKHANTNKPSTTFEGDPNLASYVLPLVIYHPLQIFASSLLARPLARYEKRRE